jgi:hypothetical protein
MRGSVAADGQKFTVSLRASFGSKLCSMPRTARGDHVYAESIGFQTCECFTGKFRRSPATRRRIHDGQKSVFHMLPGSGILSCSHLNRQNCLITIKVPQALRQRLADDLQRGGQRKIFLEQNNPMNSLIVDQAVVACHDFVL